MLKKKVYLIVVLTLGLVGTMAFGDITSGLVGYWPLDGDATDASGNGLDGTIVGDVQFTEGQNGVAGGAALFPGVMSSHVDLGDPTELNITGAMTLAAWAILDADNTNNGRIIAKMAGGGSRSWNLNVEANVGGVANPATLQIAPDGSQVLSVNDTQSLPTDEWVHMTGIFRPGEAMEIYVNGELRASVTTGIPANHFSANGSPVLIGSRSACGNCGWMGAIDEVRVYNRALAAGDVMELYIGDPTKPSSPNPAYELADVPHDISLSWTPGEFAVTHDVYLGTRYDDVNDADRNNGLGVLVSQGQDANTFDPDSVLAFGQTYYWRVDEVNGAPDFTLFKGDVWSFTVEPLAYPIEGVVATSNADLQADAGPENTVNGSGLNADDQHSTEAADMFLSIPDADPIYLQYEFDRLYKLHEMLIWNYNVQFELVLGFGIKDVTVEYSANGADWTVLGDAVLAQATASSDYLYNTTIDLGGVAARYVKLTVNSGFGMMGQYGLSEVRFMFIPAQAREPHPANGETDLTVDTVLGWRAGRDAISHDVYFGTDPEALPLADTVDTPSYSPGALDLGTTYYWKIEEIQEAESWEGAVWSFATQPYLVVEDFESYDDEENRIYETWIDGYGANDNGSTVGHLEAPFAETSIVNSGKQSMPLFYDNTGAAISETKFALAQNWTASGIKSLSLYFKGAEGNGGQLYVKINDAKVQYNGDTPITRPWFTQWTIDLASVGTNLQTVRSLSIGIKGDGVSGVIYVDDIRLYPAGAPEPPVAQDPGPENLVAHYALDNDTTDSSGQGNHGAAVGNPVYAAGISGMAIDLDGIDDRVDLGPLEVVGGGITLSLWLKPESFVYDDTRILSKATGTAGNDHWWMLSTYGNDHVLRFRLKTDDGQDTTTLIAGSGGVVEGEWTYAAAAWDGGTMRIYQNLALVGSADKGGAAVAVDASVNAAIGNQPADAGDKHWDGLIDEVRIYNRGLSEAELLYLASVQ